MAFTAGEDERVFVLCQARPTEGFEGVFEDAHKVMEDWSAKEQAKFTKEECDHLRGQFPQLVSGVAHGGGRTKAMNWVLGTHAQGISDLLAQPSIIRMAESASSKSCLCWPSSVP